MEYDEACQMMKLDKPTVLWSRFRNWFVIVVLKFFQADLSAVTNNDLRVIGLTLTS
jgi:hypothetical protein